MKIGIYKGGNKGMYTTRSAYRSDRYLALAIEPTILVSLPEIEECVSHLSVVYIFTERAAPI